jgi:hypothetical protein
MYNKQNAHKADKYILQGDVAGKYVDALPQGAKPIKGRIVAQGEATGHHHVLEAGILYTDALGNLFAKVDKPVMLLHQEHAPWILHPGIIQFGEAGIMQVEYAGDEERRVLD